MAARSVAGALARGCSSRRWLNSLKGPVTGESFSCMAIAFRSRCRSNYPSRHLEYNEPLREGRREDVSSLIAAFERRHCQDYEKLYETLKLILEKQSKEFVRDNLKKAGKKVLPPWVVDSIGTCFTMVPYLAVAYISVLTLAALVKSEIPISEYFALDKSARMSSVYSAVEIYQQQIEQELYRKELSVKQKQQLEELALKQKQQLEELEFKHKHHLQTKTMHYMHSQHSIALDLKHKEQSNALLSKLPQQSEGYLGYLLEQQMDYLLATQSDEKQMMALQQTQKMEELELKQNQMMEELAAKYQHQTVVLSSKHELQNVTK